MFLWTLWSSIKEIKAPFVFDGEHGIALHALQGKRSSSRGEGEASLFFYCCGGNHGYIHELWQGCPFKTRVCSATSGLLSVREGHLGILLEASQTNRETCDCEARDPVSLSSYHHDTGIPINFQVVSDIVAFCSTELCVPLKLSKACETSCRDEAGTYGFL